MPLPKIASTVHTFKTLSGKKINFRAYKIGDEQALLEAKESKDPEIIVNTVLEVLQGIVLSKVDIKKLPVFDVEHLLLSSRIVSVGNISKIRIKCDCGKHVPVELDLSKAYIDDKGTKDPIIDLGDEEGTGQKVTLFMKYPTFEHLNILKSSEKKSILRVCIDYFTIGEDTFSIDDSSDEELDEWLSGLPKDRLLQVFDFINGIPKMAIDIKETCSCGKEIEWRINDFETFFT